MSMRDDLQQEEEIVARFNEVEKQCDNWRNKGYEIMTVYQPITGGTVATDFYKSMLSVLSGQVWTYMADKHKVVLMPMVSPHFPIDANRNMAVSDAREKHKAKYIFFMDTDQTFPPLTIPTMFEAMLAKQKEHYIHVMAGMYFAKKNPWAGVFGRYSPWSEKTEAWRADYERMGLVYEGQQLLWWKSIDFWTPGSIFQVDVIGAGCMMMPTDLFDALEMPYFKYLPDFQKVGKQASEDMWFCATLKKAGIPIFMHSGISCGHLTAYSADEALHTNQRDTFYEHAPLEKRKETYSKMIDLRTEEEKKKWRNQVLAEHMEDE